ncbi:MAG: UpxY family transcription antiterminator [bacterium]|nr:UpxY family transcription antiterminator [bacterium]
MSWFALTVKPRHEKAAAEQLDRKGLESFLPLYKSRRRWSDRWKEVQLCLFPGYVFCRFAFERRMDVLGVPAIRNVVGFGNTEEPVPDSEIQAVQSILTSGRPVLPWEYLQVGDRVRIVDGSMTGIEGILLRRKDAWRVIVSVELLRRSVAVEIDHDMVRPG